MNSILNAAAGGPLALGGELSIHRLGFGAMRITGPGVWGHPPDISLAVRLLRRAVHLGVNFIDTADAYGPEVSENLLARALYPYPADLVIATKGGLVRPGPGEWVRDGRPVHLREACEASLKRLRRERIDLYQLHALDPAVPLEESVGELGRLRAEGKVRHIGVSNVTLEELRRCERVVPVVAVQNRFNIRDRHGDDVLEHCAARGTAFLPWAPLGRVGMPLAERSLRHWRISPSVGGFPPHRPRLRGCCSGHPSWCRFRGPPPWGTWRRTSPQQALC